MTTLQSICQYKPSSLSHGKNSCGTSTFNHYQKPVHQYQSGNTCSKISLSVWNIAQDKNEWCSRMFCIDVANVLVGSNFNQFSLTTAAILFPAIHLNHCILCKFPSWVKWRPYPRQHKFPDFMPLAQATHGSYLLISAINKWHLSSMF